MKERKYENGGTKMGRDERVWNLVVWVGIVCLFGLLIKGAMGQGTLPSTTEPLPPDPSPRVAERGETIDLTDPVVAGLNLTGSFRTFDSGTRVNSASGAFWLPWSLHEGERIELDVYAGYGESREGIAVGTNRILANRFQSWLELNERTTIAVEPSRLVEAGSAVAFYDPVESASVGLWVNSTDPNSALKVLAASFYPAAPTPTPTASPTETSSPTPTVAATFTPTADWRPDPSEIPGAERVHRMEVESGTGPRWINVWELWRVE